MFLSTLLSQGLVLASTETMASYKLSLFLLALINCFLFLSHPASCNEEEDKIFEGLNSFKQSLKKNSNAECLADEIADELEDQPCSSADDYAIEPGNGPKFPKFNKLVKKCLIDINTTTDGIILPVCVPNWDPDLVIKNYTHTQYAKYLNGSKYTGAGVGTEDDWVVVVLSTDTESGSFSGAPSLAASGIVHYMMAMLLGFFLILLC